MNWSALATMMLIPLVGCAPSVLHTETSTAAIRSAEALGAAGVPQAALHLQLAKENVAAAVALNEDNRAEEALSLLLRAQADAELALALSVADGDRQEAEAAILRVRELQLQNPYANGGAN